MPEVLNTLESVSLNHIADTYGTPCYVYSKAEILRAYHAYTEALGSHPGAVCYAVKANSNLAVLQVLVEAGAHFDIVSGGELERVIRAGGSPERIIFSGVGKTKSEMQRALELGIACFNVESEEELHKLSQVCASSNITANISLRVNPDVDAKTHPYISTGLKENKFGVAIEDAPRLYQLADSLPGLNIIGVDCHIGSQLTEFSPFIDALDRLLQLIDELQALGITIKHLDLGGGVGVRYKNETVPPLSEYIGRVKETIADRDLALKFEPGRSIVANAGLLLTEVLYLKTGDEKNFAIVDAAMNDNLRPSLYSAWQDIRPVQENTSPALTWDVVGPICETGDFIGKDRELSLSTGDRLALMSSGAYGFVMASNYNTRGRAPEVLVDGDQHFLIRERENFDDLIRGEHLLPAAKEQ